MSCQNTIEETVETKKIEQQIWTLTNYSMQCMKARAFWGLGDNKWPLSESRVAYLRK